MAQYVFPLMGVLLAFALAFSLRRFIPRGSFLRLIVIVVLAAAYAVHILTAKYAAVERLITLAVLAVAVGYFAGEFFRARKSHG